MATNSDLIAAEAAHATFINRVAAGNAKKVAEFLEEAETYIVKRLAREGDTIRNQARLNAVLRDVRKRLNAIYTRWEKLRDEDIAEIGPYEAGFQVGLLGKFTGDADLAAPSDAQILKAAQSKPLEIGRAGSAVSFNSMLSEWKPSEIRLTNGVINSGFALGQTTQEISQRIRREVMPISRRDSDSVVITATNHMSNTAKVETYQENSDIVIGYRLIATLDSRTTAQCRSWDQTVVLWEDDFKPAPPFHWNCRTQQVPELSAEFAELDRDATRSAKGAEGGEKTSSTQQYYDWLNKQPASFQDDALGRERGLIFRNSGLTPEDFRKASVNRMGEPLTIAEMAQRDERIKEYLEN